MEDNDPAVSPLSQGPFFTQVVDIKEAINWIAHENFAGPSLGPRLLFEFSDSSETLAAQGYEDLGREQLAFDLLWNRAELGSVKMYGRKALFIRNEQFPDREHWDKPARESELVPPEVLASASWTEDDEGAIEGEGVSYWGVTVDYDDLLTWFPSRGTSGPDRPVEEIRSRVIEATQSPSSRRPNAVASTESKCRRWMAELAAQEFIPRSRDDLFSQALSKFPEGLTRRGFDRCWDSAAPDSWKRAGRKPRQD